MNGKNTNKVLLGICFEFKETESELKNKIYTKILNGPSS